MKISVGSNALSSKEKEAELYFRTEEGSEVVSLSGSWYKDVAFESLKTPVWGKPVREYPFSKAPHTRPAVLRWLYPLFYEYNVDLEPIRPAGLEDLMSQQRLCLDIETDFDAGKINTVAVYSEGAIQDKRVFVDKRYDADESEHTIIYSEDNQELGAQLTKYFHEIDPLFVIAQYGSFDFLALQRLTQGTFKPGVDFSEPKAGGRSHPKAIYIRGRSVIDTYSPGFYKTLENRKLGTLGRFIGKGEKTLTVDELRSLTLRAAQGDADAANLIIQYNMDDVLLTDAIFQTIIGDKLRLSQAFNTPPEKIGVVDNFGITQDYKLMLAWQRDYYRRKSIKKFDIELGKFDAKQHLTDMLMAEYRAAKGVRKSDISLGTFRDVDLYTIDASALDVFPDDLSSLDGLEGLSAIRANDFRMAYLKDMLFDLTQRPVVAEFQRNHFITPRELSAEVNRFMRELDLKSLNILNYGKEFLFVDSESEPIDGLLHFDKADKLLSLGKGRTIFLVDGEFRSTQYSLGQNHGLKTPIGNNIFEKALDMAANGADYESFVQASMDWVQEIRESPKEYRTIVKRAGVDHWARSIRQRTALTYKIAKESRVEKNDNLIIVRSPEEVEEDLFGPINRTGKRMWSKGKIFEVFRTFFSAHERRSLERRLDGAQKGLTDF